MKMNFSGWIVSLLLVAAACSDDDSGAPDKMPLLTRNTWRIVELVADGKAQKFGECFQENKFTFTTDGKYEEEHNCALIAGGDQQNKWEFQENQSKFKWDYETEIPSTTVFEIVTLDDDAFELETADGKQAIRFEAVSSVN